MYSKQRHYSIALLCDGHGGDYVASYVKNNFVQIYKECAGTAVTPEVAVRQTLSKLSDAMRDMTEGTTVVGAIVNADSVFVFNIGDSRCYGVRHDGSVIRLTRDHTLSDRRECKRLRMPMPRKGRERRLDGVLAMTRSIGDADVKNISSEPDVRVMRREDFARIVLMSDGIYSSVKPDMLKLALNMDSTSEGMRTLIDNSDGTDDRSVLILSMAN